VALVAAAFVLLNTALLSQCERRHDLALLRALGASRGQLWWLLTREALTLGVPGTLAGLGLGLAFSVGLVAAMGQFLGAPLGGLRLTVEPFALGAALGQGLTLGAALVPVWRAGRRDPLADLLARQPVADQAESRLPTRLGCALLGVGLGLALGLSRGWLPPAAVPALFPLALMTLLAGGTLALPLVSTPLLWLAGKVPLGLEYRLALGQIRGRPGRTNLTAGVLFLSVAVAVGFGHQVGATLRDLRQWYRHTVVADFLVRSCLPDTTFSLTAAMPESIGDDLGGVGAGGRR
jgi:putative ABC transport system permease protein